MKSTESIFESYRDHLYAEMPADLRAIVSVAAQGVRDAIMALPPITLKVIDREGFRDSGDGGSQI